MTAPCVFSVDTKTVRYCRNATKIVETDAIWLNDQGESTVFHMKKVTCGFQQTIAVDPYPLVIISHSIMLRPLSGRNDYYSSALQPRDMNECDLTTDIDVLSFGLPYPDSITTSDLPNMFSPVLIVQE